MERQQIKYTEIKAAMELTQTFLDKCKRSLTSINLRINTSPMMNAKQRDELFTEQKHYNAGIAFYEDRLQALQLRFNDEVQLLEHQVDTQFPLV